MSVHLFARRGHWAALALATLMAGCGGGGSSEAGGDANLSASSAEAQKAVETSVAAASTAVSKIVVLGQNPLFDLSSPSAAAATSHALAISRSRGPQAHILLSKVQTPVQPFTCVELDLFTSACTGSATVEASFAADAAKIPVNGYVAMSFTNLSGQIDGVDVALSGQYRIDFLTEIDTKATSYANAKLKLSTNAFAGKLGSYTFGPDTTTAQVDYDAKGAPTITIGDQVFSNVSLEGSLSNTQFRLGTALVKQPYWASGSSNKIDYQFQPWEVKALRPAVGSVANLSASNGATAKVEVSSSSTTSVVYTVQIVSAGTTKRYSVTASYPSGSNTPSYSVTELA